MSALKEKQHKRMHRPLWKYTTMRDHDCWIIFSLCSGNCPLSSRLLHFFSVQRKAAQSMYSIYSQVWKKPSLHIWESVHSSFYILSHGMTSSNNTMFMGGLIVSVVMSKHWVWFKIQAQCTMKVLFCILCNILNICVIYFKKSYKNNRKKYNKWTLCTHISMR